MKAMVLAAGFGTRLRPYSNYRPKPLFPVLDRPLLLHALAGLRRAGFADILVNCHHLKEQVAALLAFEKRVVVQEEDEILGTGGGLRRAMGFLGGEPALVLNGDIFHNIDLAAVYARHLANDADVTLVLHDKPRFNQVAVAEDGKILSFRDRNARGRLLAFTGIHLINPDILSSLPGGCFLDIIDSYEQLLAQGALIKGLRVAGHYWTDMGTPSDYLDLHGHLLSGEISAGQSPFLLADDVILPGDLNLRDWAVVGSGAVIGAGVSLERVVVWDGAVVDPGLSLVDTIIV